MLVKFPGFKGTPGTFWKPVKKKTHSWSKDLSGFCPLPLSSNRYTDSKEDGDTGRQRESDSERHSETPFPSGDKLKGSLQ
ncbi:Telomerase Protein Component 1 [Manis pentadactyla]|nr:Telomerase Protein Component 1 [Manis pentadactyla]